jgi:hypothetical protein
MGVQDGALQGMCCSMWVQPAPDIGARIWPSDHNWVFFQMPAFALARGCAIDAANERA